MVLAIDNLDLTIIIPTLNESGTIGSLIESLQELYRSTRTKIIIIDDGSTDGTIEIIQDLKHDSLLLIKRGEKLGFGTAIRDGFKAALDQTPRPDLIVTMDADLSHDPQELPKLIQQCTRETLVIGSRYTQGGEIHGWSPYRKTVSWGANFLARVFANIPAKDCTSGYRCYGSALVQAILQNLESVGYDIQIEILSEAARRGFEIKETPIRFQDRTTGESKLKSGQMWEFAKRIYVLFKKSEEWIRIIKFILVGLSGIFVNVAVIWFLTEKIGLYYLYSGILSSETTVLNNFFWNDRWTFKDKINASNHGLSNRLIKFHISRFSSLMFAFLILFFMTEILSVHYLISNICSLLLVLSYNYLTSKDWVWN